MAAPLCLLLASLALLSPLALRLPAGEERALAGALSGWKFCVDAGHGGAETGAVGPTGLQEKEVNLKVALRLRDLLLANGAQVLMTRESDVAVSITQRWQMANSWGADRFISIHHNAYPDDPNVNGTETLVSTYASQASLELANSVQAELVGEFGLPNRGVKKVGYCGVLNNTNMPAILTEASFISNPAQERLLRDDAYLAREAMAILRGIRMPSRVSFIQPQENRISSGVVNVSLQVLGAEAVSRMDLFLDGGLLRSFGGPPFSTNVDTASLGDGTHRLRAVAYYGDGGTAAVERDLIVASAARKWYFAEGATWAGIEEWLTVLNPNGTPVDFSVQYLFQDREALTRTYRVEAEARLSINVGGQVGAGRDVSLVVDSPLPIVAERPMYFLYRNRLAGGHVSGGSNQPSTTWYFAEGHTGDGFDEWLCLLNPGNTEAKARVEYLSPAGLLLSEDMSLAPRRRYSVFVNGKVGPGKDVSLRVTSTNGVPLVAERPMYFLYRNQWAGGHVSGGSNQPSTTWYFAEGYTGAGFEEWLCLFNPDTAPNRVRITYQTRNGANIADEEVVPPLSRRTVNVNLRAGANLEVSVKMEGERPFVAERSIYHDYGKWCKGGDVLVGVKAPSRHWYLAEGYTGPGFEDWLCLQNAGAVELSAEIMLHFESGELMMERVRLPASSRTTLYLNSMSPYQEGMSVSVHATGEIVVERPIYFRYNGSWVGGHVNCGYAPGMSR
ncbi:MAG: N-acetylmuramoyl-L-alanine amidase [Actinobacteria bacterium]|nr:N-acetylmuramoyl-L-alanine amidase [Actinomycetota bacterium]